MKALVKADVLAWACTCTTKHDIATSGRRNKATWLLPEDYTVNYCVATAATSIAIPGRYGGLRARRCSTYHDMMPCRPSNCNMGHGRVILLLLPVLGELLPADLECHFALTRAAGRWKRCTYHYQCKLNNYQSAYNDTFIKSS